MTETRVTVPDEEPIGIVISRGRRSESTPRFTAYVWGVADDDEPAPAEDPPR
jgi:hypothetical protein